MLCFHIKQETDNGNNAVYNKWNDKKNSCIEIKQNYK